MKKTYRSKKYLAFVRTLPCTVPIAMCQGPVAAHHTETGGVGMKGPDLSCVPLCALHHQEIHSQGRITFQEKHSLDIQLSNLKVLRQYIEWREQEDER